MQDDVSARWAVLEKRVMAQLDAQPVQSGLVWKDLPKFSFILSSLDIIR